MSCGVVIAGGGLAAQRCAETLRRSGYDGGVTMLCAELDLPYDRPPLSKGALLAEPAEPLSFRSRDWYAQEGVRLLLGARAAALDASRRRVRLDSGRELAYDMLLIATGAAPRSLPMLGGYLNALALRTAGDARRLRSLLGPGARLVIVGAGFIGMEVAATARAAGADVTLVELLPAPLAPLLGAEVSGWLADLHARAGVRTAFGACLADARGGASVERLELADGRVLDCDAVVVAVGVAPEDAWLADSGLDPGGVRVDEDGRTAIPHVFAAGDVCRPFDPRLGRHVRTEHWEAAARQGVAVARAMLGRSRQAGRVPSFWSDQHGLRLQYAGHAEGADRVDIDGDLGADDFSVLYRRRGRPVAAFTAGRPRELVALRRLIEDGRHVSNPTKEMIT